MSQPVHADEQSHLREAIISQCIWSDTYSSVKHILKRIDNQLPLLISFTNNHDNHHNRTILFFDRNLSNKMLFNPLRQLEDKQDQFEVYPRHCTFAITDIFKGAFEFMRNGQRCSRIFSTLEQLVDFATEHKCIVVFMSRDRVQGRYTSSDFSTWTSKEYSQGSLFTAQRIHRASSNRKSSNDRLECLDEEGYTVFLKMGYLGRYSIIATSKDQQENQPEHYLHSTQSANIGELIKRLTLYNNNSNNNNCIRLVRGAVPYSFHCQYLQLVRQHTHDVLVGLTQEGLIIEWNLESHAPCRYATNLNDILNKLSGSWEEQLLEGYIDEARSHYRENFRINIQLTSTSDWAAFFQYWKWTGDVQPMNKREKNVPYQSSQRFHLVASIQDLSDDWETLSTEFIKLTSHQQHHETQSANEHHSKHQKKLTANQHHFLSEMNKILTSASHHKPDRMSLQNPRPTSLLLPYGESPFDKSEYDSNPQISAIPTITSFAKKNARRTQ